MSGNLLKWHNVINCYLTIIINLLITYGYMRSSTFTYVKNFPQTRARTLRFLEYNNKRARHSETAEINMCARCKRMHGHF